MTKYTIEGEPIEVAPEREEQVDNWLFAKVVLVTVLSVAIAIVGIWYICR